VANASKEIAVPPSLDPAGAVEAIFTILAAHNQAVPGVPTFPSTPDAIDDLIERWPSA